MQSTLMTILERLHPILSSFPLVLVFLILVAETIRILLFVLCKNTEGSSLQSALKSSIKFLLLSGLLLVPCTYFSGLFAREAVPVADELSQTPSSINDSPARASKKIVPESAIDTHALAARVVLLCFPLLALLNFLKEAVAADWLRMEAPVELRYAIAQGRMSWTAYLQWLETEQSKQEEVVERLATGEKVTTSTATRMKKEGKSVARTKAQQNQVALPLGNQFEVSQYTQMLTDIRKAMVIIANGKGGLVERDRVLLSEILGLTSTCVEGEI